MLRWKKWGIISTLTATEEHITLFRPRRADTALVWSEIRLVEIWDDHNRHYGYCLYDQDGKFIEWPAKSTLTTRFLDQEIEAASAQRQGALLALIAARTRLPFRTFASELAVDRETPPRETGTHTLRHATERTFTIALWALLSILIVTLPLTHVPSVNLSATVIGAIYGVALLVYVTINRRTRHMPEYRLPAPITTLAEAPITIAISATGRDVLRATFLGAIPASALFPLIRAFHEYQITPPESQFAALVRPMLLMGVAGVSLPGIGYLLTVTLPYIEGKNVLQVDAAGLRQGRGGRQRYIRWQDIASLTIAVYPDMGASFTVASATQVIH